MRAWSVLALLAIPLVAEAAEPDLHLPLVVHVLSKAGEPVASAATVATLVGQVNALYAEAGICFAVREVRTLDRDADLESYRDRRSLVAFTVPHAINIFLVSTIHDPEPSESTARADARVGRRPSGWLGGAEIPAPRRQPSIYLIVQLAAGFKTMAHELGHFLGEGHHKDADNLMGYGIQRSRFDDKQLASFRRHAQRQLRARTLDQLTSCAPPG